ncbi:survival motor neuron protein-like isoform X2 [Tubulanus polymorphus]|uniref:survival motor neuron protein-like isoform X2 n=1 Tax=Tubulanus polymorphus TaxID=672921 RepID=UPI003DA6078C
MTERVMITYSEDSDVWDDTALIKAYDRAVNRMKAQMCNGDVADKSSEQQAQTNVKKHRRNNRRKMKKAVHDNERDHWAVGDMCRAIFSEDQSVYPAKIVAIDNDSKTCTVRYTNYENEEDINIADLLPPGEFYMTNEDCLLNQTASESESMDCTHGGHPSPAYYKKGKSGGKGGKKSSHRTNMPFQYPMMPPSFPMSAPVPPAVFPPWNAYSTGHMRNAMVPPPPPPISEDISDLDNEALCSMLMSWYMSGYHTGYYQGLRDGKSSRRDGR